MPDHRRFIIAVLGAAFLTMLSGCATTRLARVKPWQRGTLAGYTMRRDRDPLHTAMTEHVYFSRETASGDRGVGGSTVGQDFSEAIVITGLNVTDAQSWSITNTLPPGVEAEGVVVEGNSLVVNPSNGILILTGTPIQAGIYQATISGYQYFNRTGRGGDRGARHSTAPRVGVVVQPTHAM